jgi:hypothetical protein
MTEDRLDVCRTFVLFLAEQTPSFIGVKEVCHSPIHPIAEKKSSRKLRFRQEVFSETRSLDIFLVTGHGHYGSNLGTRLGEAGKGGW